MAKQAWTVLSLAFGRWFASWGQAPAYDAGDGVLSAPSPAEGQARLRTVSRSISI